MNPADHFTVVGLTRGEVVVGAMHRITNFTIEGLKRRAELQRERASVVERQCERYLVRRDDEEQSEMLHEMLGVSPKDYFEI